MKSKKMFLVLIILFASFSICLGQEKKAEIILLDSVVKPQCELLLNRLDFLAYKVQNTSNSVGYIVIYGGSNPIENIFYERAIERHTNFRNLDESRHRVITAMPEQQLKIEFWISENKNKPNVLEENFKYTLPENSTRILFAEDSTEVVKIDGRLTYLLGSCEVCCITTIDLNLLSKFLEVNPNFNAQIMIFNKSVKGANQLSKLFIKENIKNYKIVRSRLEITYGGVDKAIAGSTNKISTVKVWLIPQKKK